MLTGWLTAFDMLNNITYLLTYLPVNGGQQDFAFAFAFVLALPSALVSWTWAQTRDGNRTEPEPNEPN